MGSMHAIPPPPGDSIQVAAPASVDADPQVVMQFVEVDGRRVRRRVERFPSERDARAARDLDSGDFRVEPVSRTDESSSGSEEDGGRGPTRPLRFPPQPRRTGLRSERIGRVTGRMTAWRRTWTPAAETPPRREASSGEEEPQGPDL